MMGWLLAALLAGAAFALMALLLKAPRRGWEAIGAALMLGIAGYGFQAHPRLAGSPREAREAVLGDSAAMVQARRALSPGGGAPDTWLMVGDALARHGQYADAAGVLLGAVDRNPRDGEAWLALGNALVGHAQGLLTPAALYAYRQAAAAAPDAPGPPFFLGLALAQSGRLSEAHEMWARLIEHAPPDAPWRTEIAARLQRLDALIAAQPGASDVGR
ncbi:MAG: tetratricopeptide repeat protein [Novosphingobium sp.]